MNRKIDDILEGFHKGEYDLLTVKIKLLELFIDDTSLPVYAITLDNNGELQHNRFSAKDAGNIITKLSKKVNKFEAFIDFFNKNYR